MNCPDCREKLHELLDGTLSPGERRELDAHLAICDSCRTEWDSLHSLRTATAQLSRELAPTSDLWPAIEAHLAESVARRGFIRFPLTKLWKVAACLAVIIAIAGIWKQTAAPTPGPTWQIAALAGRPRIDAKIFEAGSKFRVGEWLETDATSRAKVSVGNIGEVEVEPNSRLRLLEASPTDHRLELARGTLSALIWSPPRLFFVNTPSAVAVDLGCAYTLNVDDEGNGTLHVTSGYVALQQGSHETVISAGQMCTTRRGAGPGTPYAADAPRSFQRALDRFDFERDTTALNEVLTTARAADAVTLFNLLLRTQGTQRGRVFDTLARHHPPPAEIDRAGIVAGDEKMLDVWSAELGLNGPASF